MFLKYDLNFIFAVMILKYKNGRIHYNIEGEGSAIVLLHGFLETSTMWHDLIPEFSNSHQVFSIDLLGHGKTDCLGYVHTMEEMAEAVFAVLNYHNIETADIIGHSMGGYVALALSEQQPQLFRSLVLMNSTYEADDDERKNLRLRANEMAKANIANLVRMSFANLFAPESRLKFKTELDEALAIALDTTVQGYIAASEGMRLRPNRFKTYKNLNSKKLIIVGVKDWIVDSAIIKKQAKDTDINIEELSEGHMSHIENKSELTYILKRFIEK